MIDDNKIYCIGSGAGLGPARKLRFRRYKGKTEFDVEFDDVIVASMREDTDFRGFFTEVARIDLIRRMVFGPANPHGHTPKGVRIEDLRIIDEYLEDIRKEDDNDDDEKET
jgi:hypothetical protein